jgi:hypothetical protein
MGVDLLKPDVGLARVRSPAAVWAAMRDATEIPRPAPPVGVELDTLVDWARAHAGAGDGRCSVIFEVLDGSNRAARGEAPPAVPWPGAGYLLFREALGIVRRLRDAEADPSHGRWLFVRLETTATRYTIERRYDSWPAWMPSPGAIGRVPGGLRREMDRRSAEYRPPWAALLG